MSSSCVRIENSNITYFKYYPSLGCPSQPFISLERWSYYATLPIGAQGMRKDRMVGYCKSLQTELPWIPWLDSPLLIHHLCHTCRLDAQRLPTIHYRISPSSSRALSECIWRDSFLCTFLLSAHSLTFCSSHKFCEVSLLCVPIFHCFAVIRLMYFCISIL